MSKTNKPQMSVKPSYDEEKTTQAASLLLELNDGKMNYMKLIKLLYNADREALKRWSKPITYDDYYSLPRGQVVSNTMDRIRHIALFFPKSFFKNHIQTCGLNAVLRKDTDLDSLSFSEIELLKELDQQYKDKSPFDMEKEHHNPDLFPEYVDPEGSRVETDFAELLGVLGKSDEEIADLISNFEELALLEQLA